MDTSQFISNLNHHKPDEDDQKNIKDLRNACKDFACMVSDRVPDGRAKSLAQTKLEECLMWAVKGLVVPGA